MRKRETVRTQPVNRPELVWGQDQLLRSNRELKAARSGCPAGDAACIFEGEPKALKPDGIHAQAGIWRRAQNSITSCVGQEER